MNLRHLMRMSMWARRPPSERRVKLVFLAIAIVLVIGGIEYLGWWPDWAKTDRIPRQPKTY